MLFTADKKVLEKAILPTSYGIASKNTDPILEGIFLELKDDTLTMCTYDLEKGIRTKIPVETEKEGTIVVDAQKLIAIIQSLPDGAVTLKSDENHILKITASESEFQILGRGGENFPNLPNVKGEITFTLPQKKLRKVISGTLFAASSDDTRPIYTGSLFEINKRRLTAVALNGNRLAVGIEQGMTDKEDMALRFILPGKAQGNLLRIMEDTDEPVTVEMARKHIIFSFDNIYFITRLLEGEFLDYTKKIPAQFSTTAILDRDRFIESVERAALIIDEKRKSSIKLIFGGGVVRVSCNTDYGKVNDSFLAQVEGEDLEIGFNHRYLLDALRASYDETVRVELSGPLGPAVITPAKPREDDCDYLHLILPVKLKD